MPNIQPVYAVATYEVTDRDAFMTNYAGPVHAGLSEIGAEILSATGDPDVREGDHQNNWSVLLKFPSAAAFDAYYGSDEYRALKEARMATTVPDRSQFYVLPEFSLPAA